MKMRLEVIAAAALVRGCVDPYHAIDRVDPYHAVGDQESDAGTGPYPA